MQGTSHDQGITGEINRVCVPLYVRFKENTAGKCG